MEFLVLPPLSLSLEQALTRIEHDVRNLQCLAQLEEMGSPQALVTGLDQLRREVDCMRRITELDRGGAEHEVSLLDVLQDGVDRLDSTLRTAKIRVALHLTSDQSPVVRTRGDDLTLAMQCCIAEMVGLARPGSILEVSCASTDTTISLNFDVLADESGQLQCESWSTSIQEAAWRMKHLALVWAIQSLSEHGFRVRSRKVEGGCRFALEFDGLRSERSPGRDARTERTPSDSAMTSTSPPIRSILVVDDSREAASSWAFAFQQCGLKTWAAYDGRTAIDLALLHQPDVLLLDLGLPIVDGVEVTRQLRAKLPQTQIVVLTGFSDAATHSRARAAGCDKLLVKPIPLKRLLAELGILPR